MYNYVYKIYAFVKFLDEPPVLIYLSCHPGHSPFDTSYDNLKNSNESYLWHRRMGYLNFQCLSQLSRQYVGIPILLRVPSGVKHCDSYHQGKSARNKFPKTVTRRATKIVELIHSDLCGPSPTKYLGGAYYFIMFIDDFSRKTWIYFMFEKDQALSKF